MVHIRPIVQPMNNRFAERTNFTRIDRNEHDGSSKYSVVIYSIVSDTIKVRRRSYDCCQIAPTKQSRDHNMLYVSYLVLPAPTKPVR